MGIAPETRSLSKSLKTGWGLFLDLLYPPLCRGCGAKLLEHDGRNFCNACWNQIATIRDPICLYCGCPLEEFLPEGRFCPRCPDDTKVYDRAASVARYEGVLRDAIHWFKHRYKKGLGESLGKLMLQGFQERYQGQPLDAVVPVPLHWLRQRMREFNQARILAEPLARDRGIELLEGALLRIRYTTPQMKIRSYHRRKRNIAGAFQAAQPERIRGKKILLVDDLYTSGSTIVECSRVLKAAGAEKVFVMTLARAGLGDPSASWLGLR